MSKQIIERPMPEQCTMATYEAIADSDLVQYRDYTISDYPSDGANTTQMAYALTCKRLFPEGTIIMFSGDTDDTYTKGHCYQIKTVDENKAWVDITPKSENTIPLLVGTQEKPINFATDMEVGKLYKMSGFANHYKLSEPLTITADVLIVKTKEQEFWGLGWSVTLPQKTYYTNHNSKITTTTDGYIVSVSYQAPRLNNDYVSTQSFYAPETRGTKGQILQSTGGSPTWIDNPAPRIISNTIVSNWVADITYTDFGYKADISITNLTENDTCEVIFNQADASSGNYAQVNSSSAGTLTIYSKVNTEITIPTIIIIKGGY